MVLYRLIIAIFGFSIVLVGCGPKNKGSQSAFRIAEPQVYSTSAASASTKLSSAAFNEARLGDKIKFTLLPQDREGLILQVASLCQLAGESYESKVTRPLPGEISFLELMPEDVLMQDFSTASEPLPCTLQFEVTNHLKQKHIFAAKNLIFKNFNEEHTMVLREPDTLRPSKRIHISQLPLAVLGDEAGQSDSLELRCQGTRLKLNKVTHPLLKDKHSIVVKPNEVLPGTSSFCRLISLNSERKVLQASQLLQVDTESSPLSHTFQTFQNDDFLFLRLSIKNESTSDQKVNLDSTNEFNARLSVLGPDARFRCSDELKLNPVWETSDGRKLATGSQFIIKAGQTETLTHGFVAYKNLPAAFQSVFFRFKKGWALNFSQATGEMGSERRLWVFFPKNEWAEEPLPFVSHTNWNAYKMYKDQYHDYPAYLKRLALTESSLQCLAAPELNPLITNQ